MNPAPSEQSPPNVEPITGPNKFVLISFSAFFLLIGAITLSELLGAIFR